MNPLARYINEAGGLGTDFNLNGPEFLVVDKFLKNPDAARSIALDMKYEADERYHKGKRSKERLLYPWMREYLSALLNRRVTKWMEYGTNGIFQYCTPSDPIVVHSDGQMWAAALYLTPDETVRHCEFGLGPHENAVGFGTTFYRCLTTGFRKSPTAGDVVEYNHHHQDKPTTLEELTHDIYDGKLLSPEKWEVVDRVGCVYNRLVIWNARLLHSATGYFGSDAADSRLFQLFFFDTE